MDTILMMVSKKQNHYAHHLNPGYDKYNHNHSYDEQILNSHDYNEHNLPDDVDYDLTRLS